MRLSKVITTAIKLAKDDKDFSKEVDTINDRIAGAIKAYDSKAVAAEVYAANKDIKFETAMGPVLGTLLDDESLLHVVARRQKSIVTCVAGSELPENYSSNAELARAIATDTELLGALYFLTAEDAEGDELL